MLPWGDWAPLAALGGAVGAVLALTGAGGGALAVPLLVLVLGWSIHLAAPVALVAVGLSSLLGAAFALREGIVRYRAAMVLGAAGMVAAPVSSVYPGMGGTVLIICFVVVVIGGIGSIRGALLAALLIGAVDTFGKVFLPQAAGVLVYVLMALILLWKPDGLFKAA